MKKLKILFSILFATILLSGCVYNYILPEVEIPPIDPEDPDAPQISFKTDIIPIFNDNNYCTSCHGSGGRAPDLTTENAYNSINNTRYINSETPAESRIYTKPHPDSNHPKKYSANEATLVLGWIVQGAKDN